AMVIVETVALSTMVCNDLIVPVLLRVAWLRLADRKDLSRLFLRIRRGAIVFILLLGYIYFHFIGGSYALVTIGLVSFAAAAQFAPAIFGGIYWKGGTRRGAIAGLSLGFLVWIYTLLLPAFALSGWLPAEFATAGAFGLTFLKPYALFGLEGMDQISHSMFWSMLVNIGAYVAVSLVDRPSPTERIQATLFVEVFRQTGGEQGTRLWRGSATVEVLRTMVERFLGRQHVENAFAERFLGRQHAENAFADYARRHRIDLKKMPEADGDLVQFAERMLAGAIGAASARAMVASVIKGEGVSLDEIMQILDETSQVLEYSRQLEQKSKALEDATAELQAANERLKELDQLKDEFLSTVTHELRTPLTSVRSFSEILYDTPDLKTEERQKFLAIIIRESERLTRLINQVLDLTKIEAGRMDWQMGEVDLKVVIEDAVATLGHRFQERSIALSKELPDHVPAVMGDRDQLMQVVINLLSNAEKFCRPKAGKVMVSLKAAPDDIVVSISDNGPGIAAKDQEVIFEKFHQVSDGTTGNPTGLAISRKLVEHFGGRIWVASDLGKGAVFSFSIPIGAAATSRASGRA
ncbi:MAG: histidine kinase, partial [Rhodospirillales bacterium]|nr:histidine kinase [Rhodospirillales bacterium]